jgi:hypothetical protein
MTPELQQATLGGYADINALFAPENKAFDTAPEIAQQRYNTNVDVANQKAAEAAQIKALEAKSDPSKFQRVKKKDGGFAFYNGAGEEISAYDYAVALDKNPTDVLQDSENPIDLGYQQDFKNLNDYIEAKLNAKYSADDDKFAKQIEDQVREQQGVDLGSMNIDEVLQRFKEAYPTVYGLKKPGVQAGTTLLPYQQGTGGETDPTILAFQQALQGQ